MTSALSWTAPARWVDANERLTPDALRLVGALIRSAQSSRYDAAVSITPTGSPFVYTAPGEGVVAISGGTVSAASLVRLGVSVALRSTATAVPVSSGDQVSITYSSAPVVTFIPR